MCFQAIPCMHAGIICSDLSLPTSGMITYSDGSTNNRPVNSSATHSCNAGYTLTGGDTRFCLHDGTWSESASVCQRKWNRIWFIIIFV